MIQLEVWGPYALFTRGEMKVERVSYDVPTPSAARGIVESLYYHPGIRWHIRRIYVLNPIEFTTIRRNEVKSKILGGTAMRIAQGKEDEPYLVTTKQIVQRHAPHEKRPVLFHPVLRLPRVSRTLQAVGGWPDPDD